MQRSWPEVRGLRSGHEKAAFVKARARDREVAQSELSREQCRETGGEATWDTAPTSCVSCSVCNPRLCNTLQTARNRLITDLGHKDGKKRTRACLVLRLRCLGPYPPSSPLSLLSPEPLPAASRSPRRSSDIFHTYLPLAPTPTTPQRGGLTPLACS
jgi:hypothetical protein